MTLLKVIVLSRFLGKFKNLKQTVGLPYQFYCFFLEILKKKKKNFFVPPTLNLKNNSFKSTNKKILASADIPESYLITCNIFQTHLFGLILYVPVNRYGHVGTLSVHQTFFLGKLDLVVNQFFVHILSLVTDKSPS